MSTLSLVSLNCESQKHWDRIIPFLQKKQPDVFCFQEVFESDFEMLKKTLSESTGTPITGTYTPIANVLRENKLNIEPKGSWGVGFLTRLPFHDVHAEYYKGTADFIPDFDDNVPNSLNRAVTWGTLQKDDQEFTIATTHFTWSPHGSSTPEQFRDLEVLLKILANIPEFALCGDFNAPRGGETFARIAEKYTDNIPAEVASTIDPELHRVKGIQHMIDCLFTTPGYTAKNVEIVCGLSDHCAVVAEIESSQKA